jgi:hypothetical protein
MIEKVNKIKSLTFEEIISSENVMLLLSTYSALYLDNRAPSYCEKCIRNYYNQILNEGLERAFVIMEAKKRTLTPNWTGIKYINGSFFDSTTISDAQAVAALKAGTLREKHFLVLPQSFEQVDPIFGDLKKPEVKRSHKRKK